MFCKRHGLIFLVGTSPEPEILLSLGCCISPICLSHLTCLLVCFVKSGHIPVQYWHSLGRLPSWEWSEHGWTGGEEAGERLQREMALTERWSSLSEQYESLFPCFWLLLFSFFLVSLVLHSKPNSMRQHGLQNTICGFFVKWRKWGRREFRLMH